MYKKELRTKILSERRRLDKSTSVSLSAEICNRIVDMDVYRSAKNICLYMPINNEVNVTLLLNDILDSGKHVWLPKVHGDIMDFYHYDKDIILESGVYDILEPQSDTVLEPDDTTVIIMPGAVFSKKGDRVGYGGGYYDKYLSKYPMCQTIAVCYNFQIIPEIPTEEYDIKPKYIVSESQIITTI